MKRNRWAGMLLALTAGICLSACSMGSPPASVPSVAPESTLSLGTALEGVARIQQKSQEIRTDEGQSDWIAVQSPLPARAPAYEYQLQRNGYLALEEGEQAFYRSLLEVARELSATPDDGGQYRTRPVPVALSDAHLRKVISALRDDNPQLFWLTNSYSIIRYTGPLEQDNRTEVALYSFLSPQKCEDKSKELGRAVERFLQALPAGLDPYGREQYIHDYIASSCSYNRKAYENMDQWQDYWDTFSSYGALVSGSAVCEGYARAFQLLASYAGLPSSVVSGESQDQGHMWNVVKLGDEWYHMDLTWDDTAGSDQSRPYYFNLSESQISKDHTLYPSVDQIPPAQWEGEDAPQDYNVFLPECTATEENYFHKEGFALTSFAGPVDQQAIEALQQAVKEGQDAFYLTIASQMGYWDAVEKLFQKEPYKFAYYIEQVNRELAPDQQIALDQVTYIALEGQRGVVVNLPNQSEEE